MEWESRSNRWRSLGIAWIGTDPGSVRLVLACEARLRNTSTTYISPVRIDIPPVAVKADIVAAEYNISTHTIADITDPA